MSSEAIMDPATTPAMPAPPGEVNNLADAYSQQGNLIITAALTLSISAVFVFIRVFTKAWVMRQMRSEDYALVIAQFGFAAFVAVIVTSGENGQGRHLWNVSLAGLMQIASLANISEILYGPVMFAAKFSVLKQMERIFVGTKKDQTYWWIQAMIWSNALFDLSIFVAFVCACIPREKLWNPELPGMCIDSNRAIIATSIINIVSDWTALILPLVVVFRLKMSNKQKLGVGAIFLTGLLACVASIIRLAYSVQLTETFDLTWAIDPVGTWAFVEFSTVILSGCFPILPKFVQYLRYGRRGAPTKASATGYSGGSGLSSKRTGLSTWNSAVSRSDYPKGDFAQPREYVPLEDSKPLTKKSDAWA